MLKRTFLTIAALLGLSVAAHASEPTVLYDASGNAVVAYLTCNTVTNATVLYTSDRSPIAAYLKCKSVAPTPVVVVKDKKGPIEKVVSSTRAQSRRVARRVSKRHNDD